MKHSIFYFITFLIIASCGVSCQDVIDESSDSLSGLSADTGGSLMVTCRVFNGTTFIGSASAYIYVTP